MRKMFLVIAIMSIASFIFTACEPGANTATVNKPTNAATNATTPAASSAAIEAEIKKLVSDTAAALAKNDVATLERMYADNYMLVNLDGSVQSKAERLASIRSGDTKFESFAYDEVTVRSNPEGTGAIAISRANAKGMNKGQPTEGYVRVTQVWRKTKDGWQQVSGHATRITGTTTSTPASNTNTGVSNTASNTSR